MLHPYKPEKLTVVRLVANCWGCDAPLQPTLLLPTYDTPAEDERSADLLKRRCEKCVIEIRIAELTPANPTEFGKGAGGGQRVIRSPKGLS